MVWAVLNEAQNAALKEIVQYQSDRLAAILGAAMLDDSLCHALEYRFRKSSMTSRIFEANMPLGNTNAKIQLAYLLYMFEKPMLQAMEAISDIRNMFAHDLSMSFDHPSIKMQRAFTKLNLHDGLLWFLAVWSG